MSDENQYLPNYDECWYPNTDEEEAYVVHSVNDINTIIQEIGVDIVMEHLNDYSKEQIVRWLAKHY